MSLSSVRINCLFFFFKQKTAYEMRISDWSSDVCSSDLKQRFTVAIAQHAAPRELLDKCMEGNRLGHARSVLDGSAMSLSHRPKRPMMVYSIANLRADGKSVV